MEGLRPPWYKEAIIYELRVRSFYDSNADGIGDLRGLIQKLDYLQDLGVTALWLLPFYPSPLRDDGYDIASYEDVHAECGTLRDFRAFIREAHRRDLRVITELVLNHTSDEHAWFQRARRAPAGSRWRSFYVWSDTPQRYGDARIIFKDFEASNWSWDPVAKSYYWHRFYAHQPDLNFDNPEVRREMLRVVDFWLELGVDGLRLDAIPYLFEREGTSCENLPETHAFLRELRAHIDRRFEDRMLLAEANQWPEEAVTYLGSDQCHMAFHFPIMPRLFMAIQMEDRFPIVDILEQTPSIPESCQWALFLRNHDELTLEMVTDEERDYMWRRFADDPRARINLGIRRRLAPLLGNSRPRIELMHALLFSLPGTPVLYYGDEIGMGDNVYLGDRNGVRTPMQWSPDRNAGFSRAKPQQLILPIVNDPEYHYEAVNVETQAANPSSLLWWTKHLIALRKEYLPFGCGSFEPLATQNRKVLAFLRAFREQTVLIVANLSRFAQFVELDLSRFSGLAPMELLGRVEFPSIGEAPYRITLSPHAFHWFALDAPRLQLRAAALRAEAEIPPVRLDGDLPALLRGRERAKLEPHLPDYLRSRRWFRSKSREVRRARIVDALPLAGADAFLILIEVDYVAGDPETYATFVALRSGAGAGEGGVARVTGPGGEPLGVLRDVSAEPAVAGAVIGLIRGRRRLRGERSELRGTPAAGIRRLRDRPASELAPRPAAVEQTNTSWIFGEALIAKLIRRVESDPSPELEVLAHLARRRFPHVPVLAGHLELRVGVEAPGTLVLAQSFSPNEGDAWQLTLDELERFLEDSLARTGPLPDPPPHPPDLLDRCSSGPPTELTERLSGYLSLVRLLGRRTAELHTALADAEERSPFAPEPFNPFSRRSFYQSLRNLALRTLGALADEVRALEGPLQAEARAVLACRDDILHGFQRLVDTRVATPRIRVHGDFHLGQVLYTGRDFVVIDFEGEPGRPLGERKLKRSPFADVAGMLRSFAYARETVLLQRVEGAALRASDIERLRPWAACWSAWVSAAFLGEYLEAIRPAGLLSGDPAEIRLLLEIHLLEKAIYELGYEMDHRPDWLRLPLHGILEILGPPRP